MSEFLGYRIKSTNIARVEKVLHEARANLREAAIAEYHRMLSEEICEVVDDISLNIMQRPAQRSILDEAAARLNERIGKAEMIAIPVEYNLRTNVSIIPDKEYTYIMLSVANDKLKEAFESTAGIENFKVTEDAVMDSVKTEAASKWESLRKRCVDTPSIMSAELTNRIDIDTSLLKYESRLARAKVRARRAMTSRLLNQYACGKEIQNHQLMPLMDKALAKLLTADAQEELNAMTSQLAVTLIDITDELVLMNPANPIPPSPPAYEVQDYDVEPADVEQYINADDDADDGEEFEDAGC